MPVFRTVKDAQKGAIKLEAIHQPIYDSNTISTANDYTFFASGLTGGKTLYDTNLPTAANLSWPKRFSVRAIRQVAAPGVALFTDFAAYLGKAIFNLTVGEKKYLVCPAFLITAGTGLESAFVTGAAAPLAPANGQTYFNHGRPDQRSLFGLIHPVYIPPVQVFNVVITVLSSYTAATSFKLHVFLEGELLREVQ